MPIRIGIHSHLDHLIPTAGHDDRVHDVRREADAGDPVIELSRSKLLYKSNKHTTRSGHPP